MLWPVQCLLRPLEHLLIQRPLLQGNDAFTRQRRGCSLSRAGEGPMRSGDRGRPSPGMQGSRRPRPHSRACTGLTWRDPDSPPQARTGFRNPPAPELPCGLLGAPTPRAVPRLGRATPPLLRPPSHKAGVRCYVSGSPAFPRSRTGHFPGEIRPAAPGHPSKCPR